MNDIDPKAVDRTSVRHLYTRPDGGVTILCGALPRGWTLDLKSGLWYDAMDEAHARVIKNVVLMADQEALHE